MDDSNQPVAVTRRFHRDLALIHRLMGNWEQITARLAAGPHPRSVLDIGCGDGALVRHIREQLHVEKVMGVDLKRPVCALEADVLIADATTDPLPLSDAAVSVMLLHHLQEEQVVSLIQNMSRSVNRLICLDLVRHPLPLVLYTVFMCPLLSRVGAEDGRQSIRRAFTGKELRALVTHAIEGTDATFEHWISPVYARQVIDIRWPT